MSLNHQGNITYHSGQPSFSAHLHMFFCCLGINNDRYIHRELTVAILDLGQVCGFACNN